MPKRPPEYIEGTEAVQRFEGLMKRVLATPRTQAGQTVKEAAPAYGKKKRKRGKGK